MHFYLLLFGFLFFVNCLWKGGIMVYCIVTDHSLSWWIFYTFVENVISVCLELLDSIFFFLYFEGSTWWEYNINLTISLILNVLKNKLYREVKRKIYFEYLCLYCIINKSFSKFLTKTNALDFIGVFCCNLLSSSLVQSRSHFYVQIYYWKCIYMNVWCLCIKFDSFLRKKSGFIIHYLFYPLNE